MDLVTPSLSHTVPELVIALCPGNAPDLAANLTLAGLPVDDLDLAGRHFYRFGLPGQVIGFAGWEEAGDGIALLRSLVVLDPVRGKGFGRLMTDWVLSRLADTGVRDAYALTTSAEVFFTGLGFHRVDRDASPPGIRQSRQFGGLCPVSAVLLHRALA